jgi:hypothetical protein
MLTVLIETGDEEEDALARTLASLVGAAVEGVVRDVVVCERGSGDRTRQVAEHAGCVYLAEGGLAAGLRQAKGEWVLLLEPGARLADGWSEAVLAHVARAAMPARFSRSRADRLPFLARILSSPTALSQGLVIRKGQALSLSRTAHSAEALARGLASRLLDAEIRVAPGPGWRPAPGPRRAAEPSAGSLSRRRGAGARRGAA